MQMWRWALAEKLAPYVVQIPQAFLDMNDQQVIDWFNYDHKWKQDINFNLGFGDAITNITNSEAFENSTTSAEYQDHKRELEQIEDQIPVQQLREFTPIIKSTNYTAIDRDFVNARNNATITFDPNADYNDQIIVANGDGTLIKIESTIDIKYKGNTDTTLNIRNEGTTLHFHLFTDGTEKFWGPR